MLKKTGLIIMLFATLCFILTGCITTEIGVRIDGRNGGDLSTTLLIEKNFYGMMSGGDMNGLDGMTKGETTVDGTDYVTFTDKKSFKTYAELEAALLYIMEYFINRKYEDELVDLLGFNNSDSIEFKKLKRSAIYKFADFLNLVVKKD